MLDDIPNGVKLAGLAFFGIAAIGSAALIRPEAKPVQAPSKPLVAVSTTAPVQAESPDPWASEVADEPPQEVLVGHDPAGRPIYRPKPPEQAAKEQTAANEEAGDEPPAEVEEQ